MHVMGLAGYSHVLSVAPGERVDFMVTCEHPSYRASMVRLLHGDRNPAGPGFKQTEIGSTVDGDYAGRAQTTAIGSYGMVANLPRLDDGFGLTAWFCPTIVDSPAEQCLFSRRDDQDGGFSLLIRSGQLSLQLHCAGSQTVEVTINDRLAQGHWHFLYAGLDSAGIATLSWKKSSWLPKVAETSEASITPIDAIGPGQLYIAAGGHDDNGIHAGYNGKIAAPQLFRRALDSSEREAIYTSRSNGQVAGGALVAAWNLSSEPHLNSFRDTTGRGYDGVLFNRPTSAVTDHRWNGETADWKSRPDLYEAVLFHSDDLSDAGWNLAFSWDVPPDLSSGLYAAWLRAEDAEDHVPVVVRPPRTHATAEIGVLMPTFTYLAYANERVHEGASDSEFYGPVEHDPRNAYLSKHPEWGSSLYDRHLDGSGVCYSSGRRPILNIRPDYRMWATRAPRGLGADLYLIDWLRQKSFAHDMFTDHDLHYDGVELLSRYRVVITGSHPEYFSERMLDAIKAYLDRGGRLMYLGGNGFYWVTSIDPSNPHMIEVRRGFNGTRLWESAAGEGYHSTTGEQGGLWRYRGKDPNRLVGIGFASSGRAATSPGYRRNPDAQGPIAELMFAGVDEECFGEHGLVMGGAAGDELDRADALHGSPAHILVLGSSTGHGNQYQLVVEDVLVTKPGLGGAENPDVRSDITFLETPENGAVFAAGSISWTGSLSSNSYDNAISTVTENALRALLTVERWPQSTGPPTDEAVQPKLHANH